MNLTITIGMVKRIVTWRTSHIAPAMLYDAYDRQRKMMEHTPTAKQYSNLALIAIEIVICIVSNSSSPHPTYRNHHSSQRNSAVQRR